MITKANVQRGMEC